MWCLFIRGSQDVEFCWICVSSSSCSSSSLFIFPSHHLDKMSRRANRGGSTRSASASMDEARQSSSHGRSSSIGSQEDSPAWAQQIMQQVAQLRAASEASRQQDIPSGEASDTDTEFQRPAHKDQYSHNKRVASFFVAIQKNPAKAIELAEKGEKLVRERNKIVQIADAEG